MFIAFRSFFFMCFVLFTFCRGCSSANLVKGFPAVAAMSDYGISFCICQRLRSTSIVVLFSGFCANLTLQMLFFLYLGDYIQ